MSSSLPKVVLRIKYEKAAQDYLASLPREHFMEATAQATQREITLESLALVKARRPEVHVFNELLVQYPLPDDRLGQIVPDNMVVLCDEPVEAEGSFDLPLQPARPFWVMEYVSKHTRRKDYETSFAKYEQELKVPYYLLFVPDAQEMNLFELKKRTYVSVPANANGRFAIAELDLEVALLDGWVRYWYQGELLPLPAELLRDLDEVKQQLKKEQQRAARATRRAEEESRRAEEQTRRAEEESRRAEEQTRRAEEESRRAEQLSLRAKEERDARLEAERQLAELRAKLAELQDQQ